MLGLLMPMLSLTISQYRFYHKRSIVFISLIYILVFMELSKDELLSSHQNQVLLSWLLDLFVWPSRPKAYLIILHL